MLYRNQKIAANTIGIIVGLMLLTWLVVTNIPSTQAIPRMGANVKVDAWLGAGIRPEPIRPEPFIRNINLTAGGIPATGVLTLRSENGDSRQISLGVDQATINALNGQDYARSITITFGQNGNLGSTTLQQLTETPVGPFEMAPGQTRKIPVSIAVPLSAGDAAAGQQIHLTLEPEETR